MSSELTRRLFTVEECYRMAEVGILRPDERVELIRGELIVKMSPIGPRHGAAVDGANRAFVNLVGQNGIVRIQGTVVLDQLVAPEPDVVLLRPRDDFYVRKNPGGEDIFLIVEVADSSLDYDTSVKSALYAILGVPEYWVADLQNDRVLCYFDPEKGMEHYRTVREFHRGDVVAPQLLPDCQLQIDVLLP
jgi:Uma2 family endonuclease